MLVAADIYRPAAIDQLKTLGASLDGDARAGLLRTPHGDVPTPVFCPVGTHATVKAASPRVLHDLGATQILVNAYHLHLRPGDEVKVGDRWMDHTVWGLLEPEYRVERKRYREIYDIDFYGPVAFVRFWF